MTSVSLITITLILAGTVLLAVAAYAGSKARRAVPEELHGRWNVMIALMIFFLAGYVAIVFVLAGGVSRFTELFIGPIFFGGALFVFIVINVSREAIGNVKTAQEELSRVNESLEQRVEVRTHQLEQAYEFLRTVMDSLHDPVSIIDTGDFRIVGVNAEFLRVTNLTEEEIIGRTCYEVTHQRKDICSAPDDVCPLRETMETGKHAVEEHVHFTNEGARMFVEVSTSPVKDRDGKVARVVHVQRDITERRRAEELLRRSATELRETNEELKSFVYSVSHDLRAPLVNVKGFAAELERSLHEALALIAAFASVLPGEKLDKLNHLFREDIAESIGFIGSSIDRMDGLISAMLKLSRFGGRELRPEPLDLAATVQFLLATFAHQIDQKGAAVTVGALPAIVADKTAMEQIMGNLLDNALKYLEPGRSGRIEITAEKSEKETIVRVRDNGRGIAADDIHKIFEIFRRAGKQDVTGEGMGLAYVKALVRRQGGRIWCESEPGVGSTFSFTIPLTPAPPG